MVRVLDLLAEYCDARKYPFERVRDWHVHHHV
jgi:hypothetical protein